jgi:hypothetical protein
MLLSLIHPFDSSVVGKLNLNIKRILFLLPLIFFLNE